MFLIAPPVQNVSLEPCDVMLCDARLHAGSFHSLLQTLPDLSDLLILLGQHLLHVAIGSGLLKLLLQLLPKLPSHTHYITFS